MTQLDQPKHIGIIGSGKIGIAVGSLLLKAGHKVSFSSRHPESLSTFVESLGPNASVNTVYTVAQESEIIVLSVPYQVLEELIPKISTSIAGKIIIDTTNPMAFSSEGRIISSLGQNQPSGLRLAQMLPSSKIVRAYNHIPNELLYRGLSQSGIWAMAIAGDDKDAKNTISQLVEDSGFKPVDIGTMEDSLPLDPSGVLFPHLFTKADMLAILK